jgi:prepilin-type N-terminal cleavage/methylation domain-containing protein
MPDRRAADSRDRRKPRRELGMTLLELMIVFAIISVLAAVSIPLFLGVKDKAIWGTAHANLAAIRSALSVYAANQDSNTFPSSLGWADVSTETGILHYALLPPNKIDAKLTGFTYTADASLTSYVMVGTVNNRYSDSISATPSGIRPGEYPH